MYFWDLTIDTVTTINLLIAIGLTVDYLSHIAHTFMTKTGDRNRMHHVVKATNKTALRGVVKKLTVQCTYECIAS